MDLLSDHYILVRSVISPEHLGWPCARPRQIVYLYLKSFIYPLLRELELPARVSQAETTLIPVELGEFMFKRATDCTWKVFMIADHDDVDAEDAWARSRDLSRKRAVLLASCKDKWQDMAGSARSALAEKETGRAYPFVI